MKVRGSTDRIIIHHSASPPETTLEQITQWHKNKGFETVGYHYVIEMDGTVRVGRPNWAVGAHAIGANNDSIGICLTGNFEQAPPTREQMASLTELIKYLRVTYGRVLPYEGHKDVDPVNHPTACPGRLFPWAELKERLAKEAGPVTTDEALNVLKANGVISDTAYWAQVVNCVKYMDALVVNVAEKLKGVQG